MTTPDVIIANAVRTPFGRYFGALSGTRPDDLLGFTLKTLAQRTPSLDLHRIDDVIIGDANGAGEDNRNVARMGALLAGFPTSIPGVTLNRLCGSGAEAFIQGSRAIRSGDANFIISGGVEAMSRAPWIVERMSKEKPIDPVFHQSTVGWRMTNPLFPDHWVQSLGRSAEIVAEKLGITRTQQDEWAMRSHHLASAAWDRGIHSDWVAPFAGLSRDESIRPDSSLETLGALKPAFSENGSVTAGNSSPINDGSVAALLTTSTLAHEIGLEPIGKILAAQVVATEPDLFTLAPVSAINRVLARINKKADDIAIWEINEAFASMVLTVLHEMPEIDRERVNVNGGAIAMGHPVGASASRVIIECARELKRRGGGIGIAAACIGVGLGVAIAIEV
jgi:acetyl-CoA acetyltransferase family protein